MSRSMLGQQRATLLEKKVKHWEDKATEFLKLYQQQGNEVNRLNRLMPHIGGTCKWLNEYLCTHSEVVVGEWACITGGRCSNNKWTLKD